MYDILITEEIRDPALDRLGERYRIGTLPHLWQARQELYSALPGVRALFVRNMTRVDRELIESAPDLEVVGRVGVGLDNLDLPALTERGIVICYPPEENAISVAEFVFAMLLGLARHIPGADRNVREGRWDRSSFIGFELAGKTMGLLGLGRIGFRVATRARAFGMRVVAYDPYLVPQHSFVTESGAELAPLEQVLRESDVVTCHLPLTDATRHLLNEERLGWMKHSAVLINTSRGPVVDEAALLSTLRNGLLGGACLDVREQEPAGPSPLHDLSNVLLAPHVAGWTREALERMVSTVAQDVDRVLSGEAARGFVNFPRPRL